MPRTRAAAISKAEKQNEEERPRATAGAAGRGRQRAEREPLGLGREGDPNLRARGRAGQLTCGTGETLCRPPGRGPKTQAPRAPSGRELLPGGALTVTCPASGSGSSWSLHSSACGAQGQSAKALTPGDSWWPGTPLGPPVTDPARLHIGCQVQPLTDRRVLQRTHRWPEWGP